MVAVYKHTSYGACVVHNVYGWWMLEKDGSWRRIWGPMHSSEPTDTFRSELRRIKPLELLVYSGLTERRAALIGIPNSGITYRGPQ